MKPPTTSPAGAFTVQPGLPASIAAPTGPIAMAWPRAVQLATAALLFLAAVLLTVHAVVIHPSGSRPSVLQRGPGLKHRVDLNKASRAELLQVRGVGPMLAERIESYRREKGGFANVDELLQVRGIGPATLQRLRPYVCVNLGELATEEDGTEEPTKPIQRTSSYPPLGGGPANTMAKKKAALLKGPININRASQAELQQLPGIGPKLSERILQTREKQRFARVEDLRRVPGIGAKTLEKLRPHVTIGD